MPVNQQTNEASVAQTYKGKPLASKKARPATENVTLSETVRHRKRSTVHQGWSKCYSQYPRGNQPRRPRTKKWTKKMWSIYPREVVQPERTEWHHLWKMEKNAKNSIKQVKSVTEQPVSSFLYFVVSRFLERHLKNVYVFYKNTHIYLFKMNVQMKLNKRVKVRKVWGRETWKILLNIHTCKKTFIICPYITCI